MSKYVTGMKRNQIIQRWLQGIDDEQYEVFPTKKEGKYIVKQRKQPLIHRDKSSDNLNGMLESSSNSNANSSANSNANSNAHSSANSNAYLNANSSGNSNAYLNADSSDNPNDEPPQHEEAQPMHTPTRLPNRIKQHATQRTTSIPHQVATHDTTINLEILEQLRSLGEELRNDRFKREQKQYIKHVVNKELSKPRIRSKYVPELFPDDDIHDPPHESPHDPSHDPPQEPPDVIESTPSFRSRIRR